MKTHFPTYHRLRAWTEEKVSCIRKRLENAHLPLQNDDMILVCGSYARGEASEQSDLDYFLISDENFGDSAKNEVLGVLDDLQIRRPAEGGPFGNAAEDEISTYTCDDILNPIGGEDDSNNRITRRILLLLEGDWLVNEEGLHKLRGQILERYIQNTITDHQLALFLLNDVIRYWRTMTVDYEFKTSDPSGPQKAWAVRNVKLMFSRKLLYSSGLFSIALTADKTRDKKIAILEDLFDLPVVERMIAICGKRAMRPVLKSYDRFLGSISDCNTRQHLEKLKTEVRREDETFRDLKNEGHLFTRELLKLFENRFDSTHPIRRAVLY